MTKQEYTALVDRAKQLSYEYYVLAQPTISDAEFDALVADIEQTETEHQEWTLADSPTQQVGSDLSANGRRLIRHRTPMLSCQKAQTQEAVTKWMTQTEKRLKKVNDLHYVLEWKLDGISCSLVYQDGRLISAATRGDKNRGQDLLAHVMLMPSVPQRINMAGRVEVRGEIVCPKRNLAALGYKDCRTASASLCNQQQPSRDMALLEFAAWQFDTADGIGTESVSIDLAADQGFKTSGYRGCWGEDVLTRLDEFEARREAFEWPTDGVVIKIDTRPLAQSLGATEHHPKGSIAYKFAAAKTVTRVVSIKISVGATGRRTPVCYLEPVTLLGREVKQAAIGSEAKMQQLGVKEGCLVEVGLSNDVKPYIYRVIDEGGENVKATPEDSAPTKSETEAEAEAEVFTVTEAAAAAEPVEQEQPEVCPAVFPQEEEEETPTPSPLAQMQAELEALRRENARLQAERELQRQLHRSRSRRVSDGQRQDIDPENNHHHTDEPAQPATVRRKPTDRRWLKPLAVAAASVVACIVIYETGLLIPMGLIGLATSRLVK